MHYSAQNTGNRVTSAVEHDERTSYICPSISHRCKCLFVQANPGLTSLAEHNEDLCWLGWTNKMSGGPTKYCWHNTPAVTALIGHLVNQGDHRWHKVNIKGGRTLTYHLFPLPYVICTGMPTCWNYYLKLKNVGYWEVMYCVASVGCVHISAHQLGA
jgi:hypothetical protein